MLINIVGESRENEKEGSERRRIIREKKKIVKIRAMMTSHVSSHLTFFEAFRVLTEITPHTFVGRFAASGF